MINSMHWDVRVKRGVIRSSCACSSSSSSSSSLHHEKMIKNAQDLSD
mgnify:CR=1 FL=1